ncbi:ABC transporter permease subunit [Pullulanibacillus sp. KACC 23026]|uniref:ABC transporter permease n=1 Tax=Pullulanibacillus sp. KACC 23026 TaxID=3028315 RepID=UPI0023AFE9C3|nr:ABC transporter permease subunit [Pullulanibacillus sp. KACC 23026]WEG15021.1 ABC transporter permease subunit [Pullulanibacillus sp. KACC 23026]
MRKDVALYVLLILPLAYLVIFKYIPMAGNIIAFRRFVPGGSMFGQEWVGLYYIKMFIHDPSFWGVFKNNIILSFLTLIFCFPLPIILALLLNEITSTKFKKFVQTASYLPHFISVVIVSGMILEITSSTGVLNILMKALVGHKILFMQDPSWFRPIYVGSEVWQTTGWGTILYLAALTNIDTSLYEAARIDGANRWKQTIHITLPGILPTVITLLILNIGNLMAVGFEKILLIYNPLNYPTSDVISTYLYRVGLQSSDFSYATAIGLFESIIGFALVFSANYLSRKLTDTSLW